MRFFAYRTTLRAAMTGAGLPKNTRLKAISGEQSHGHVSQELHYAPLAT
jgi:hypothetical protein